MAGARPPKDNSAIVRNPASLPVPVSVVSESANLLEVSSVNSTATPLIANASFTGQWVDLSQWTNLSVAVSSDVVSAVNGCVIQWSIDGVAVDDSDPFTIKAGASKQFTFGVAHKYFRVVYTNGATNQTTFRLKTILHKTAPKPSSHRLQDSIVDDDDVELNKSVMSGKNPAGTYVNFGATTGGNFKTSIEEFESGVSTNSKKQLNTSPFLVDEFGVYSHMLGDNLCAGAPVTIDVEHHEVHCGDSYMATRAVDLANGASDIIIINVPNETGTSKKRYHMTFSVIAEAECQFDIFEGATTAADGTAITQFNRDRDSANTTGLTMYHTPTTAAGGTNIETRHFGSGKSSGGETRGAAEIILKTNTKYRIVLTNATTSNNYISWEINHYVHPGI